MINHSCSARISSLSAFVDMERERIVNFTASTDDTEHLINSPPFVIKDQLWKLFGLPKTLKGEVIDHEQRSWSAHRLHRAIVFLEDAANYKSIVHKVSRKYLFIYRCFNCATVQRLHRLMLTINLCLAFFEWPSSFSITSDVRDQPKRVEFPFGLLMTIEGITLIWFLFYIVVKIMCLGFKQSRRKFWITLFLLVTLCSLAEWFIIFVSVRQVYQGVRIRRIFRPILMIESSQLMKKAFKAVQQNGPTILASISLALLHILFFATMALFLYPRSDTRPDTQGSTYFANLHDAVFQMLVLSSTANNPDVMMPAYSQNRLNVFFFITFVFIGIYWIQNIISAVVYRAFRGYFLNAIVKSVLRRRIAARASFEILRERLSEDGLVETRDTIPIYIVQLVVSIASMKKWHADRINQTLLQLSRVQETVDLEQYCSVMKIMDLNPRLVKDFEASTPNDGFVDRLKAVGRSKTFDLIGTVLSVISVALVTVEVVHRHKALDYDELENYTLPIVVTNLTLLIYFVFEVLIKAWAFGPLAYFRASWTHLIEALVAFTCLILHSIYMGVHGSPVVSLSEIRLSRAQRPFLTLWSAIKMCNMLFIYRLIRFLPASKNIQIIIGTVIDEIRNGGAFFGVLFSFYYAYSILGMELFHGATAHLYNVYNQSNITVCGTYEELGYWANGFDDLFSSIVTLYNVMIVNQWFVFVNAFRDATQTRWSELYFIIWYLLVTTIGLNICLALSGDIHEAKKIRADKHNDLIVSNMFDIYQSQLNEPTMDQITEALYNHPYVNFRPHAAETIILI